MKRLSRAVADFTVEREVVSLLCAEVDSPRSLAVKMMLEAGEWEQMLSLKVNPQSGQTPDNFARDYLVTEVLKKSPSLPTGIDRAAVATAKFYEAEKRCWETNHRMLVADHPKWFKRFRHEVARVLGPLTRADLNSILGSCRMGPGATTATRGRGVCPSEKYDGEIHLTHELMPFLRLIQGEPWWLNTQQVPRCVVPGNEFTTVPKNALTDRGICIEPSANIFLQLGIGAHIRHRLRRYGVDLNSQADFNRFLARMAYTWHLATIDLSAASDTVADLLVRECLPPRWYHLLQLARSHSTLVEGKWVPLEKHSSMGNGYTFELETLLFFCLARAILPPEEHEFLSVYGDDIIVPQAHAGMLVGALNYCGFKVNGEKSYLAGSFFESCGRDFYCGVPVRPIYLQGSSGDIPYKLQIANALRLYSAQGSDGSCDSRYKPTWDALVASLPRKVRATTVPAVLGDTGLITSLSESRYLRKVEGSFGYVSEVWHFLFVPDTQDRQTYGVFLSNMARRPESSALTSWAGRRVKRSWTMGKENPSGSKGRYVRRRARVIWPKGLDWL